MRIVLKGIFSELALLFILNIYCSEQLSMNTFWKQEITVSISYSSGMIHGGL
jgi:hypothetical protein